MVSMDVDPPQLSTKKQINYFDSPSISLSMKRPYIPLQVIIKKQLS